MSEEIKDKSKNTEFTIGAYLPPSPLSRKILRTAIIIFFLLCLALILSYHYQDIRKKAAFAKKVGNIERQISLFGKLAETEKGYERNATILKALNWIGSGQEIDRENPDKWNGLHDEYLKMLDDSPPVEGSSFVVPTAAIDMAFIPKGIFLMGKKDDENGKSDELPRRAVSITYGFWMARTEITNQQFWEFFPSHGVQPWKMQVIDRYCQPAVMLDWHMASYYCERLNQNELKAGRVPENYEYRLPTEAEWEYACRAGSETIYFWGNAFGETGAKFANIRDLKTTRTLNWREEKDMPSDDSYLVSAPAGSYEPNAFGLYDMTGNVSEWCWDWYNPTAYKEIPAVNPVQSKPVVTKMEMIATSNRRYTVESTGKVIRGGSWGNAPSECRSASRDASVPELKNTGVGFRIVLAPKILIKPTFKKEPVASGSEQQD